MKTKHYFIDLTQRPPRSFRVRLGNYVILARMLDKGRATLAKKNGEYVYDCATDQRLVQFLGFDPDALLKELASGKGDGEMLEWVQANSKTPCSAWEIADRTATPRPLRSLPNTWANFQKPGKTSKPGSNSANSMTMSALAEKRKSTFSKSPGTKPNNKIYEPGRSPCLVLASHGGPRFSNFSSNTRSEKYYELCNCRIR